MRLFVNLGMSELSYSFITLHSDSYSSLVRFRKHSNYIIDTRMSVRPIKKKLYVSSFSTILIKILFQLLYIYILIIKFWHSNVNVRLSYYLRASILWMLSSLFLLKSLETEQPYLHLFYYFLVILTLSKSLIRRLEKLFFYVSVPSKQKILLPLMF